MSQTVIPGYVVIQSGEDVGRRLLSGGALAVGPIYAVREAAAQRYVTSGELSAGGGSVTQINQGENLVLQPTTITTTGSIAVTPNPVFASLVVREATQISGVELHYAPVHAGVVSGATRYVTSGDMPAPGTGTVTSIVVGSNLAGQPSTITTTGSVALAADIAVSSMVVRGASLLSGSTLHFAPVHQGLVSGATRYVTSGELTPDVGGTVTSIARGENLVFQPATITTTGSIALSPDPVLGTLVVRGATQISGQTLHYAPVHAGSVSGATRYVTSGDLTPDAGGTVTSVAVGTNLVVQPATITTTGSLALSPDVAISSLLVRGATQISGGALAYAPVHHGVVSGATRYVTSGDLTPGTGGTVTSITVGANLIVQPATITTTGSLALTPSPVFESLVVRGATQVSGAELHYAPIHQGAATGAGRYVTSGELRPDTDTGITSINAQVGLAQTIVAGTGGNDFAVSSAADTHTLNLPDAGLFARGALTVGAQVISGAKTFAATVAVRDLSVSGTAILYGPAYQGGASQAQRYVVSGEMQSPGVGDFVKASANYVTGSPIVFGPDSVFVASGGATFFIDRNDDFMISGGETLITVCSGNLPFRNVVAALASATTVRMGRYDARLIANTVNTTLTCELSANNSSAFSAVFQGQSAAVFNAVTHSGNYQDFTTTFRPLSGIVRHYGLGTVFAMEGIILVAGNTASGTVTTLRGAFMRVDNTTSGLVTSAFGVQVGRPLGAIEGYASRWTNIYGVEIQDQNPSGAGRNDLANPSVAFRIQAQTATSGIAIQQQGTNAHNRLNSPTMFGADAQPVAGAALEVRTTSGIMLLPRLTQVQRNAITAENGMFCYLYAISGLQIYQGGAWRTVSTVPGT